MIVRLLSRIADLVVEQVPADRWRFLVLDAEGRRLLEREWREPDRGDLEALEALIGEARRSGRPVLVPDPESPDGQSFPPQSIPSSSPFFNPSMQQGLEIALS